jgi:hypothetical protein
MISQAQSGIKVTGETSFRNPVMPNVNNKYREENKTYEHKLLA